jgi:ribonuclease HIII
VYQQLTLESYQIPRFAQNLSLYGVIEAPPRNGYEVFRGILKGGEIYIQYTGEVSYVGIPELEAAVEYACRALESEQEEHSYQRYAVLAQHPDPPKVLRQQQTHLNTWLTLEQYHGALRLLEQDASCTEERSTEIFKERVFSKQGKTIEFHRNGKVISEDGYPTFAPLIRQSIVEHLPFSSYDLIIGQDEVGNGESIGPLVIASVGLTPEQMVELQLAGIKDSKMVPHRVSVNMSTWIRQQSQLHQLLQLNPLEINQMGNRSVLDLLRTGHSKIANELLHRLYQSSTSREHQRILVVVDQYDYRMDLELEQEYPGLEIRYFPRGEKYCVSVAAASILAKAQRYRWKLYYEKIYGITLRRKNMGQIRRHPAASHLIRRKYS